MADLTRDEHHLLDWLSKDDTSARGECKGAALTSLCSRGLACCASCDPRGEDYDRMALTETGWALFKKVGEWKPVA